MSLCGDVGHSALQGFRPHCDINPVTTSAVSRNQRTCGESQLFETTSRDTLKMLIFLSLFVANFSYGIAILKKKNQNVVFFSKLKFHFLLLPARLTTGRSFHLIINEVDVTAMAPNFGASLGVSCDGKLR